MSSDQQELRNWVGWKIVSEDPAYCQNENTSAYPYSKEIQSFTIDTPPDQVARRLMVCERVMKAREQQAEEKYDALYQESTREKLALAESNSRLMEQNAMLQEQVQKGNDCSIALAIELQQVTEEGLKDRAREGKYWCNTRMELKSTKAQVVLLTEKVRALRAKIARGKARALSGMSETWDNGVFDGLMSQLLQEHGDDGNIWTEEEFGPWGRRNIWTLGT